MSKNIKNSGLNLKFINFSEIARKLGISPAYVSLILRDKQGAHYQEENISIDKERTETLIQ